MNKKQYESVLKCRLTDEQAKLIEENFEQFANDPTAYRNDRLCDIICEGIMVKRREDIADFLNDFIPKMNLKHQDEHNSLAWGLFDDAPVYVMHALGSKHTDELIQCVVNSATVSTNNIKAAGYYVAAIASSDNQEAIFIIFEGAAFKYVMSTSLLANLEDVPGMDFIGTCELFPNDRDEVNPLSLLYVPFMAAGNGRNPILWNVLCSSRALTMGQLDSVLVPSLVDKYLDWSTSFTKEELSDIYSELKNHYPAVDLETQRSERYRNLLVGSDVLCYNRNGLAYSGNVLSVKLVAPIIFSMCLGHGGVTHNVGAILSAGGLSEAWHNILFEVESAVVGDKVPEPKETLSGVSTKNYDKVSSSTRGANDRKSPIGKLLANASSDYEQETV